MGHFHPNFISSEATWVSLRLVIFDINIFFDSLRFSIEIVDFVGQSFCIWMQVATKKISTQDDEQSQV